MASPIIYHGPTSVPVDYVSTETAHITGNTYLDHLQGNIPAELKSLRRFVPCRGKKPTNPDGTLRSNWSESGHLMTWDEVVGSISDPDTAVTTAGLCLLPDDPYTLIDLDHIAENAALAKDVVAAAASYTERSMSGNGYHIVVKGQVPDYLGSKAGMLEIRRAGQQVVLTGVVIPGRETLADVTDELVSVLTRHLPATTGDTLAEWPEPVSPPRDDDEIEDRLLNDPNHGDETRRLWDGDTSDHSYDHSTADYHLCRHILWLTQDYDQADRLFRASGLMREKWDARRGSTTYGDRTLQEAMTSRLKRRTPFYDPSGGTNWEPTQVGTAAAGGSQSRSIEAGRSTDRPRFRLLSRAELRTIPPPTFLVDGILLDNAITALSGQFGTYKSFAALSLAASAATGLPWYGQTVNRVGHVVYVAGEGANGLDKRLTAWEVTSGFPAGSVDTLHAIGEGPDFLDRHHVAALLDTIAELPEPPSLVVVDTLSQTFSGDENSNRDMRRYVAACDAIRRATGAGILFLHHDGKAGQLLRGGGSLAGNIDAIIRATLEKGDVVKLDCGKMKDFAKFEPLHFQPLTVPEADSCVLLALPRIGAGLCMLKAGETTALDVLRKIEPATQAEWKKACKEAGLSDGGFNAARTSLVAAGTVTGGGGYGKRYQLAEELTDAA